MRQPLVAGNWKMNGTVASIEALLTELLDEDYRCQVLVCPPSIFIDLVSRQVKDSKLMLGGQNLDWHEDGAFTGEISGRMLREYGCDYSLVGHSERRALFGESSELVAKKFVACQAAGIRPVLCVGETREERQAGQTRAIVQSQLEAVANEAGISAFSGSVIAYEPVWAIGTGDTASPEQANEVHEFIRGWIAERDVNISENIQILYGGSVNEKNAAGLFEKPDIDGALVGGASLKAEAFKAICRAAVK